MELISFAKNYDSLYEFEEALQDVLDYQQTNGSLQDYMNQTTLSSFTDEKNNPFELQVYAAATSPTQIVMKLIHTPDEYHIPIFDEELITETQEFELSVKMIQIMLHSIKLLNYLQPQFLLHK